MPFLPLRRLAVALGLLATVAAVHADDKPLRESIDAELAAVWQREQVMPPTLSDDAAFLRRIYLDLLGTIPSYEDTKEFLADTAADRRTKLIDKLLDDPRFAQQQANVWQAILIGRNPANQEVSKGRPVFNKWLAAGRRRGDALPVRPLDPRTPAGRGELARQRAAAVLRPVQRQRREHRGQRQPHSPGHATAMRPVSRPPLRQVEAA